MRMGIFAQIYEEKKSQKSKSCQIPTGQIYFEIKILKNVSHLKQTEIGFCGLLFRTRTRLSLPLPLPSGHSNLLKF